MARPARSQLTLRDIYRSFFRHKWKAALFFWGVVAATVAYVVFSPKQYHSEGKVLVRLGRENVVDSTAAIGQGPIVSVPQTREAEINAVVEVMRSRAMAEKVVDALGAATILKQPGESNAAAAAETATEEATPMIASLALPDWLSSLNPMEPLSGREKAIVHLQKRLQIEAGKKSNVVSVSYQGSTPQLAQEVVATFIDRYVEQHIHANRTAGSRDFFTAQSGQLATKLDDEEKRLAELKNEIGLASPEDRQKIVETRVGKLEDDALAAATAMRAARAEVETMREKIADLPESRVTAQTSGSNAANDGLRAQFYALEVQQEDLLSKFTEEHPRVVQSREQLTRAKKILEQEEATRSRVTTGPSRTHEQAQLALLAQEQLLSSLEAKSNSLDEQVASARSELQTLNHRQLELARLQREVDLSRTNYRRYLEHLEQSRIDQALESERISSVNVVQPASLEENAVAPRKRTAAGLGLLLAVFGSLGLVVCAEFFDHSVKTPEDVAELLEMPVLVSIPRMKNRSLATTGAR